MSRKLKIGGLMAALAVVIFSCSTEKNTFINRNYHSLTAHYNGYFNANELINQSMSTYLNSRQENYYQLLPIDPVPNEEEVIGMYPAIDTAIEKCKKVIRNHSMPSNERPSRKKEEHNRWIDENWTTIGIASFYRRDYEDAMKSFRFVRKFYKNDPSLHIGELWMAKTNMAMGKLTDAKFNLDNLDKVIVDEESKAKGDDKGKANDEKPAKFPAKIRFELEKTKAELALQRDDKVNAIFYLEESVKHARFNDSKSVARVHFILGQLQEESGNKTAAEKHYTKVIKGNADYEMAFNAQIRRTFLGEGGDVRKELLKMLKDAKNNEFKDQIYYALADIELRENDEPQAVVYLTNSAFYSINNTRQKGMAYERLGDLRFEKRDYVRAQKYYDSCANVITDNYPNAEVIRNKAEKLQDLVDAVETAMYEDSVQRVAAMPDKEREEFLKDMIKKIEKEEQERREREAARLRELQAYQRDIQDNAGNGSKWYWKNPKLVTEGYNEFKRQWGERQNEDNWRRSNKSPTGEFNELEDTGDSLVIEKDSLTVESLMANLPLADSALAASNKRLMKAYYDAGVVYKDQLEEYKEADEFFRAALDKQLREDPHDLLSAYELYKMHKDRNPSQASVHKNYIIMQYPESDYALFLQDPDYFVKRKEREALAEQEYVTVLDRYNRGIFYPVITKANEVIDSDKENIFRSKYMLLKAMSLGKMRDDKDTLIPVLQRVLDEYPETPEAARAKELIDLIKNGYSENIEVDFSNKSPFNYDDRVPLTVFVVLDGAISSQNARNRIVDFNREFFSRERLRVDSKVYKNGGIILIDQFDTESDASRYISAYKRTRKYLLDLQNAKIMMVTNENLKVIFQKQNLEEYDNFYQEYY